MDTRTGEIWTLPETDAAEKKVAEGRLGDLTDRERRYVLAQASEHVAWITPEVAEQVRRGQEAQLKDEMEPHRTVIGGSDD